MTTDKQRLGRLAAVLQEDIANATTDEILADAHQDDINLARAIKLRALAQVAPPKHEAPLDNTIPFAPRAKPVALSSIVGLTLAARNGAGDLASDIEGILEDLAELEGTSRPKDHPGDDK